MSLTVQNLRAAIENIHSQIEPMGQHLNELDGKLGDGDLGVTLINGFNNINEISADLPGDDLGGALIQCAQAMTKASGSSFGTLMATALIAAGKSVKGKDQMPWNEMADIIELAQNAMISRGGASLGDKTLLDSCDAIICAIRGLDEPALILDSAKTATTKALDEFRDQPCQIGRARVYASKSVGMDDPGMVAVSSLINCL